MFDFHDNDFLIHYPDMKSQYNNLQIASYNILFSYIVIYLHQFGRTVLWEAASSGHLEVVTLLVDAGASIDIQDNVSTRIRLCIQSNYNPYAHCNKQLQ